MRRAELLESVGSRDSTGASGGRLNPPKASVLTNEPPSDALASEILEWDVRNWMQALNYWEREVRDSLDGRRALEVGARSGGLSLYLALKGCEVVCSDCQEPTDEARRKMARHGVADRVTFQTIDVHAIPYGDETFDLVAFRSLLGHVSVHRESAVDEMYRVLKPGGLLLFAENLAGSRLHRLFRRHGVAWGVTWRYLRLEQVRELMSPFRAIGYATYGLVGCFGRTERQRRWLGRVDRLLDPSLRERSKYIVFGYARK